MSPRVSTLIASLLLMAAGLTGPRGISENPPPRERLARNDVVAACELSRRDNSPELEAICADLRAGSDVASNYAGPVGLELAMRLTQLYALDD